MKNLEQFVTPPQEGANKHILLSRDYEWTDELGITENRHKIALSKLYLSQLF